MVPYLRFINLVLPLPVFKMKNHEKATKNYRKFSPIHKQIYIYIYECSHLLP
jgi:hypothetical protein